MKNKEPIIKFVSQIDGLDSIDLITPKPAIKYVPEWWKKLETIRGSSSAITGEVKVGNVKTCPSFPDYFSNGFIIPMWCDTKLVYEKKNSRFKWISSNKQFEWQTHDHFQFLDSVPYKHFGKNGELVLKAICPWLVITKPGWSVLQLPLFYHFNDNFTILPGIVDTDIHHEVNQQVMLLQAEEEIFIPAGTPFVQIIPFKREPISFEVKSADEDEYRKNQIQWLKLFTKFPGTGNYNAMRRERDRND